jgi:4-hydroxybenzoyl-CoA reductase subunit beta
MMRLPPFRYCSPSSVTEAVKILSEEGPEARLLAGGTDLLPNMKRGQQQPKTLVSLRRIESLRQLSNGSGITLGAGLTLTDIVENHTVRQHYAGLWQAASQIASPQLRNMGTMGGNICLDTRCNFYDQSEDWRKAINYCLKKDGEICWVVTKSKKCLAVSSSDTAPALISLGARVRLVSAGGERLVDLKDFYRDDGADYMDKRADEILTEIVLDPADGWQSTFWKLRRRNSFDFAILSVAAAIRATKSGTIEEARIVLGAVASRPLLSVEASEFLTGQKLTNEVIEEAANITSRPAKPVNNTDLDALWRKKMIPVFVTRALRELRGDDIHKLRKHTAHQTRKQAGITK